MQSHWPIPKICMDTAVYCSYIPIANMEGMPAFGLLGLLDIECDSLQSLELEMERLQAQPAAEKAMQARDAKICACSLL